MFNERFVLKKCFNSFILPCFEYHVPVQSSAADLNLKLLDQNLNSITFLIPDIKINL